MRGGGVLIGGVLIEEARRRARLTQAELAARLGGQQSTIARWETGRVSPSFENVVRAVSACGLRLSLSIDEPDEDLDAILEAYEQMTPAERFAQNSYVAHFVHSARERVARRG